MNLCYFDRTLDTNLLQIIFVVDPEFTEKEIIEKIISGDFEVKDFAIGKAYHSSPRIINIIIEQCHDLPLSKIWILKESKYRTIVTVMKEYDSVLCNKLNKVNFK